MPTDIWLNIDPRFRAQLEQLIAASGGQVSLEAGGGSRSEAAQQALFLSRYSPSPNGEVSWNGQRWHLHPGAAPAAPPGRSMHEIGLAVDLTGPGVTNGWLAQNAARFGLKTFADVNGEPWHVQPAALPNGRSDYEKNKATYDAQYTAPGGASVPQPGVPGGYPMGAPTPGAASVPSPGVPGGYPMGLPTGTTPAAPSTTSYPEAPPGASYTPYNPWGGGDVAPQTTGQYALPSDAQLFNNGFTIVAVFDVGGVKVGYDVDWTTGNVKFDQSKVQNIGADAYAQMGVVEAGSSEELRNLTFPTYKEFFDSIVGRVMGYSNPARNDPEILKVLAEFAGRPDMTAAELTNRLQATAWYNGRTTSELEWNSLSDSEKGKRRETMAAQMQAAWFQFSGEQVRWDDPRIANYLEDVSSGKVGFGAWTEKVVKQQATLNGESPWSRQIRDEGEAQRKRGVDVENTAQRVKDLARRWGVQWSEQTAQDWARKISTLEASDADVLNELKVQAQVLYPWKSPDVETMSAAQPWIETYKRVLEKDGDLFDPKIQSALSAGAPVWEFEKQLKSSAEWANTKNGRNDITSAMAEVNRMMGFS